MRFYLRKVVTWIITLCVVFFISFNLYNHQVWVYEMEEKPWGTDFQRLPVKGNNLKQVKSPGSYIEPVLREDKVTTEESSLNGNRKIGERFLKAEPVVVVPIVEPKAPPLWPSKEFYDNDRITTQLKHRPRSVIDAEAKGETIPMKTILFYSGIGGWQVKKGQHTFIEQKCPVNYCSLTDNRQDAATADAVIFQHGGTRPWTTRPSYQVWISFMLECPYHTASLSSFNDVFNWTATYRHDSTIVAPYEKFVPFNSSILTKPQNKNYAEGKTKKVAWFVSNCGARNGRREIANELAKYIQVDIYGACGTLKCPRYQSEKCFDMLNKDYKFYLSFENSNCRDYITEKFFVNGLQHDVLPIVMGAAPEDYRRAAPPHSFIHVDDFETIEELAAFLHKLDQNDELYNEYFQWKGTGDLVNTYFWCRVCAMLHESTSHPPVIAKDVDKWWRGDGVCINKERWRDRKKTKYIVEDF